MCPEGERTQRRSTGGGAGAFPHLVLSVVQDMAALKGNNVEVTVIEVDPDFKKIVLSMSRAVQYKQLRAIHLGALMWGEVRRVEEFGAFVGLDGTRISGLLHVSNISRSRVESVAVSLTAYLPEWNLSARVECEV